MVALTPARINPPLDFTLLKQSAYDPTCFSGQKPSKAWTKALPLGPTLRLLAHLGILSPRCRGPLAESPLVKRPRSFSVLDEEIHDFRGVVRYTLRDLYITPTQRRSTWHSSSVPSSRLYRSKQLTIGRSNSTLAGLKILLHALDVYLTNDPCGFDGKICIGKQRAPRG